MSIQYAVYLPTCGDFCDARLLADLAREAEAAGWDGFFVYDHMTMRWSDRQADPWIALAAVAIATTRMRIGALVTPISRRRPWKLARETVTLDHLCGGRLVVGVGLGYGADEFSAFGEVTDLRIRAAMLDEGLDVLTGLWRGETFSYVGQHYQISDALFRPKPHQQPRIPIWVAGYWPNKPPFRRAAGWDGVFPLPADHESLTVDEVRAIIEYVRQHRETDAPFDVVHRVITTPHAPTSPEMVAPYAEAGVTWWLENIKPQGFGWDGQGAWPLDAMRDVIRAGPPR